jgi:hypothetical protein
MQRGETTNDSVPILKIQLHADELVSPAFEIRLSEFSKATVVWKEGKGKVLGRMKSVWARMRVIGCQTRL